MDPPPLELPQPAIPLLTTLASAAETATPLQRTTRRSQDRYIYGTDSNKKASPNSTRESSATSSPSSALPPPPSRNRTIIQQGPNTTNNAVTKTPTTAAERKHARKVAHSDIERRRRNKINQQFDALKSLIPACAQFKSSSGGDVGLHKLVILQHAVEYIEHLKSCLESVGREPPLSPPPDKDIVRTDQPSPSVSPHWRPHDKLNILYSAAAASEASPTQSPSPYILAANTGASTPTLQPSPRSDATVQDRSPPRHDAQKGVTRMSISNLLS